MEKPFDAMIMIESRNAAQNHCKGHLLTSSEHNYSFQRMTFQTLKITEKVNLQSTSSAWMESSCCSYMKCACFYTTIGNFLSNAYFT